jgi:hypothetical protein
VEEYALCRPERELEKQLPSILNLRDICSILAVSPDTILQGIRDKKLEGLQSRRRVEYPKSDLHRLHGKKSTL